MPEAIAKNAVEALARPQALIDTNLSVLGSANAAICEALGILNLSHRSALIELLQRPNIPQNAVLAAYVAVEHSWHRCHAATGGGRSTQNWRWRAPQLDIADRNSSPEVGLERALIQACERLGCRDWANQVPVASGIAGPSKERRRAIDLVHQVGPGHFELIELKVASDNPLYAAFEIIGYTCVWLLARKKPGISPTELLAANRIDAIVWAPTSFYARYELSNLQRVLSEELLELGHAHGVEFRFRFDTFSDEFAGAPFTDERIASLLATRKPL